MSLRPSIDASTPELERASTLLVDRSNLVWRDALRDLEEDEYVMDRLLDPRT